MSKENPHPTLEANQGQALYINQITNHLTKERAIQEAQKHAPAVFAKIEAIVRTVLPPTPRANEPIPTPDPSGILSIEDLMAIRENIQNISYLNRLKNVKIAGSILCRVTHDESIRIPVVLQILQRELQSQLHFVLNVDHEAFDFVYLVSEDKLFKVSKARRDARPNDPMDLEFGRSYDMGPKWRKPLLISPGNDEVAQLQTILHGFAISELQEFNPRS